MLEIWIIEHEKPLRLVAFISLLILMASWEILWPRRPLTQSKLVRWSNNLALVFLNSWLLRLVFPAAALGFAVQAQHMQWGFFLQIDLPLWIEVMLAIAILDCAIYWQHRLFHVVPLFWRLHRVHHADQDIDVTTGSRFHTIEILLSMLIKWAVILLLAPSLVAVVLFELLLNLTAMFNHSNVKMPSWLDEKLRWFLVTPDMHRVHHSTQRHEHNANYGFNLPWWDRLFGSYVAQPEGGHDGMTIGLGQWRNPRITQWLPAMLVIPFMRSADSTSKYKDTSDDISSPEG